MHKHRIALALATTLLAAAPLAGFAKANCKAYPKNEWMNADEARSRIEAQGYAIRKFKVDGNCYEIYGTNKAGKKVEIYFDAKTLDVVKSEVQR
ncbi:MAG: PepSY domain-containing protein [Ramlibacter sp.]